MNEPLKREGMRLVALICDVPGGKRANALMQKAQLPVRYRFRAEGTATSEILNYFGLENTERVVLLCAVPKAFTAKLMHALRRELNLEKPGNGILFSFAVSGVSNPMASMINAEARETMQSRIEREVETMGENARFSLVLAAVNQGYSESVMEAAKGAGVKGGTVIRARRLGMEEAMQFWGISLRSEKELVAILVPKEEKLALMQAIGAQCGMQSEAQGLVLSLPVEDVVGME